MSEWNPVGPTEESLVQRMVAAHWRLRRFSGLEAGVCNLAFQTDPLPPQFNKSGRGDPMAWAFHVACGWGGQFGRLARYENHLQSEFLRYLHELKKLQAGRLAGDPSIDFVQVVESERPCEPHCETNPISGDAPAESGPADRESPVPASRPARTRCRNSEINPMDNWGPPIRWTDFAPELQLQQTRPFEPPDGEES
jgi:hypothetical protein